MHNTKLFVILNKNKNKNHNYSIKIFTNLHHIKSKWFIVVLIIGKMVSKDSGLIVSMTETNFKTSITNMI